jgi:type I restriction enzyme M protein
MRFEEFQTEIDWWGDEADGFRGRKETEQAWKRSAEYLVERGHNFDDKNPHVAEAVNHDPEVLLKEYDDAKKEIQALRDQLKAILSDALDGGHP